MEQFKRMQKLAGLITEGEAAYEYEKGKAAGEKVKKKKIKKSDLKKQIKEMILAEMAGGDEDDNYDDYFFNIDQEEELDEAKKKKKDKEEVEDVEIDTDVDMGDEMDMGAEMDTTPVPAASDVQKELMDALEAAKASGDEKLVRQIGNALTYFTRSQVSKEEVPSMNEELGMDAVDRMDGLVSQTAVKMLIDGAQTIIKDLKDDGFDDDDIFDYIVDRIKSLD
jgi:hypothetical protein